MQPLATDDVVCSSSGGIAIRSFIILYIITALHVVLLSANDCFSLVYLAYMLCYNFVNSRSLQIGLIVFVRFLISGC